MTSQYAYTLEKLDAAEDENQSLRRRIASLSNESSHKNYILALEIVNELVRINGELEAEFYELSDQFSVAKENHEMLLRSAKVTLSRQAIYALHQQGEVRSAPLIELLKQAGAVIGE